jgi:hypothetical protein
MLYLWLTYLKSDTFQRIPEHGNTEIGVIGLLASQAMSQAINEMEIEVPTILYSQALNYAANNNLTGPVDCTSFYTNDVKLDAGLSANLCSGGPLAI